jgi:type I restriction enzyme S subunit
MKHNWEECLFEGETSLITKGTTPTSLGKEFKESGINFIKAESITNAGKFIPESFAFIDEETHEILRRSQLQVDDILFSIAGVLGRIAVVDKTIIPANTNQALALIRLSNSSKLDRDYIKYYLNGAFIKDQIRRINVQAAQANFSLGDIGRLNIQYPPLPQQEKIAKILSTVDKVIEKTESAIAKYQAIKQGLMHDLFTRGIDVNTGRLRPTPQEAPELYKESVLGLIPRDWEVEKLESVSSKIGDGIHTTPKYVDSSKFHFINGNNLKEGKIFVTKNTNCVSESEYEKHFKNLSDYTILYSINGTIGNIAFYQGEKIVLGKSAAYISFSEGDLIEYVYFVLQTNFVDNFYYLEQTGSTINNLSLASIRNTPIPIPSKNEIELIVNKLNSINNKIQTEQQALAKYQQLKAGLLQDLLTGTVEVNVE